MMTASVERTPRAYEKAATKQKDEPVEGAVSFKQELADETAATPAPVAPDAPATQQEATSDTEDGTRAAQDLVAQTLIAPTQQAPVVDIPTQTAAAEPGALSIEDAVQQFLDQSIAQPPVAPAAPAPISAELQAQVAELGDLPIEEPTISDEDEPVSEIAAVPEAPVTVETKQTAEPAMTAKGPVATTAVREPAPLPENTNNSHVHLVLDDGPERVVLTVAVRGNEVQTTIRGGDEQTAAALARNAASLDHALRSKGMDLSSFTSDHDRSELEQRDHEAPQQRRRRKDDEETAA